LRALVGDSEDGLVLELHALHRLNHLNVVVKGVYAGLAALGKESDRSLGVTRHAFALIHLIHNA
jgi:hypothetical protein